MEQVWLRQFAQGYSLCGRGSNPVPLLLRVPLCPLHSSVTCRSRRHPARLQRSCSPFRTSVRRAGVLGEGASSWAWRWSWLARRCCCTERHCPTRRRQGKKKIQQQQGSEFQFQFGRQTEQMDCRCSISAEDDVVRLHCALLRHCDHCFKKEQCPLVDINH